MKAVLCREWGGPDSLRFEEVAARPLQPDEARIRVRACGINFADTLMIAGKYQIKPEFPFTPGLEAAGEVVEIGAEVNHLAVGTAGAGGAALRRRLCRGDRGQRRRGRADPGRDGFRHRRRVSGRLRHLAFRADPSRAPEARRDAAGARRGGRGRADRGRDRQAAGRAGHRGGGQSREARRRARAWRRRADRLPHARASATGCAI